MLRWILFSVIVVGLAAAGTVVSTYLTPDAPVVGTQFPAGITPSVLPDGPPGKVELVGDPIHNFGNMAQHAAGSKDWTVKNTGQGPIRLTMGNTSCSCTFGNLEKGEATTIEAGKESKISLSWNTKEADGKYRQTAEIFVSGDPNRTKLDLAVEGTIHPPVQTFPPGSVVPFLNASYEQEHKRFVAVFSKDRPEMKLTAVKTSNPSLFDVAVEPLNDLERKEFGLEGGRKIAITLKPGQLLGNFSEELLIDTDHPLQNRVVMALTGKIVGPITLTPERFRLPLVSAKRGDEQSLTLWVKGQAATKFVVEKKPEQIDVTVAPMPKLETGTSVRYQITLKVPPGLRAGQIQDDIILKTDHPKAETIKIPVLIQVFSNG